MGKGCRNRECYTGSDAVGKTPPRDWQGLFRIVRADRKDHLLRRGRCWSASSRRWRKARRRGRRCWCCFS